MALSDQPGGAGSVLRAGLWIAAVPGQRREPIELAPPALAVLAFVIVAGVAWAQMLGRTHSSADMTMTMGRRGLGSIKTFSTDWVVMMTAMMLPSATPLVFAFVESSERRRGWRSATAVLGLTYLAMWLAFGLICYLLLTPVPMSWLEKSVVGGAALALAGVYGLTPIKRASEASCREACALHGPLPFNLTRSGAVVGAKYGLSCIGCSAALMAAMVIIGMSSFGWIVVISGVVLVYKLAPPPSWGQTLVLSVAVGGLGIIYALTA